MNIVLSEEQIGEAIWGKESFQGDDNTIMVHISRHENRKRCYSYLGYVSPIRYRMEYEARIA